MKPLVTGTIVFEAQVQAFAGATLIVRLEDVSYADAPAGVLAEYVEHGVAFDPQQDSGLKFRLAGPEPDSQSQYAVQAHVDVDGDGVVSSGDFINMQSYPVLTFGHPCDVTVLVRQVR
jgi:Uncharacterized protein conserved in bacteria